MKLFWLCGVGVILLAGCQSSSLKTHRDPLAFELRHRAELVEDPEFERRFSATAPAPEVVITKVAAAPRLDGQLTEKSWAKTPSYKFALPYRRWAWEWRHPKRVHPDPFQTGTVKLLRDEKNLYIGLKLTDWDIVQRGKKDQGNLFDTGDTVEFFFKSALSPRYMELFATPNAKRSTFFYETRTYPRMEQKGVYPGYRVAVKLAGSLNDYSDRDRGWSCEVVIPLAMLEKHTGIPFKPSGKWTIMVSRYNYTYGDVSARQLSSVPQLPYADFHIYENFARVVFK